MINNDGDVDIDGHDDSGFHSHCADKTFEHKDPPNGKQREHSNDDAALSTASSGKSDVSSAEHPGPSTINSRVFPIASTPAQVKRRSLSALRRRNNSPPPPVPDVVFQAEEITSQRMSTSMSKSFSTSGCWKTHSTEAGLVGVGVNIQLVAHTVAERRARAEAIEVERRRVYRAKLEASEAALEAARQRANSIRAARSLELRTREEERHAKATARRQLLEKQRKEQLSRHNKGTLSPVETNGRPRTTSSNRQTISKMYCYGFASELDPSDPRYCPFGFGSSSRRDVCLPAKQQLSATKGKVENSVGGGGFRRPVFSNLSASFTIESRGKSTTNVDVMSNSAQLNRRKPMANRSVNSTTINGGSSARPNLKDKMIKDWSPNSKVKSSTLISTVEKVNPPMIHSETVSRPVRSSPCSIESRSGFKPIRDNPQTTRPPRPPKSANTMTPSRQSKRVPTPNPRNKTWSLRLPTADGVKTTSQIPRPVMKQRVEESSTSCTGVRASCEPSNGEAESYVMGLNKQRKFGHERRVEEEEKKTSRLEREREANSLLESMARDVVNEAIDFAIAELKAEAVEACASSIGTGTVKKAVKLLAGVPHNSVTSSQAIQSHRQHSLDEEGERILQNTMVTSKERLNNALEKMTLTINKGSIRKTQSEIISLIANAASDEAEREERRARLDTIMSRVRAPTTGSQWSQGVANQSVSDADSLAVNVVNGSDESVVIVNNGSEQRHQLRPNGAIKSFLESGRLPSNSKAALLLRSRLARSEPSPPPIELCSPCTETASISDSELRSTGGFIGEFPNDHRDFGSDMTRQAVSSLANGGKAKNFGEYCDWTSSSASATIAARCTPRRRFAPNQRMNQRSSESEISTTSKLAY